MFMKNSKNTRLKLSGTILIVVLSLMALAPSEAQAQQAKAGIKGGVNFSNFYKGDPDDKNARVGFHGGFYGQIFASDFFALQPEILFSTRGSEVKYTGAFNQKVRLNLSYFDVPIVAVFKLGKVFEIHAGAYGGYLAGANIKTSGDLGNNAEDLDRDSFNKFDYGALAGFGINVGALQIGARYNLGLQELQNSTISNAVLGDAKNSFGQIFLAIRLNGAN
jgi:hypothetical protein